MQFLGKDAKISSCVGLYVSVNVITEEVFGLPNIKSAKKRVLVAEARNARNKAEKSALKTAIKKFEAAAVDGDRTKAAAKGLMHKNNAAHKKSALTLKLNKIG